MSWTVELLPGFSCVSLRPGPRSWPTRGPLRHAIPLTGPHPCRPQIILTANIPIFNPNYLPVRVAGGSVTDIIYDIVHLAAAN